MSWQKSIRFSGKFVVRLFRSMKTLMLFLMLQIKGRALSKISRKRVLHRIIDQFGRSAQPFEELFAKKRVVLLGVKYILNYVTGW